MDCNLDAIELYSSSGPVVAVVVSAVVEKVPKAHQMLFPNRRAQIGTGHT